MQNATVGSDTPINTDAINDAQLGDGMTIEGDIIEVKAPDPAMAVLDPAKFAEILFQPFVENLGRWKRSASRTKVDLSTKDGMAKAKEFEDIFTKIRTGADKKKTEFKKPLDLAGKKILEHFNAVADAAKIEEKKWSDLIAAEKQRLADIVAEKQRLERVRIEAIEARIEDIRMIPSTLAKADAATIAAQLDQLLTRVLTAAEYQEHLEVAIGALNTTINEVRQLLTDVRGREAVQAELERLRAADEQRKKDEAARLAEAAEADRKREAAAAALLAQQNQMAAIIEVQGLANALHAAGLAGDRAAIEQALSKARAFNPAAYGTMAPMASLARDAAVPLLEQLLADLPAPIVVGVDLGDPAGDQSVVVPIEADDTGVVVGHAVLVGGTVPTEELPLEQARAAAYKAAGTWLTGGDRIPAAQTPHDLDIVDVVAQHFGVPSATAINWLAVFDADAARAALAEG